MVCSSLGFSRQHFHRYQHAWTACLPLCWKTLSNHLSISLWLSETSTGSWGLLLLWLDWSGEIKRLFECYELLKLFLVPKLKRFHGLHCRENGDGFTANHESWGNHQRSIIRYFYNRNIFTLDQSESEWIIISNWISKISFLERSHWWNTRCDIDVMGFSASKLGHCIRSHEFPSESISSWSVLLLLQLIEFDFIRCSIERVPFLVQNLSKCKLLNFFFTNSILVLFYSTCGTSRLDSW